MKLSIDFLPDEGIDRSRTTMVEIAGPASEDATTQAPFRLLDLPQEVQDKVYEKYFEDTPALIPNRNTKLTSLNVDLTSRKVMQDARRARDKVWPNLLEGAAASFLDLMARSKNQPDYRWLKNHIREIKIKSHCADYTQPNFSLPPDQVFAGWHKVISNCPNLRHICFLNIVDNYSYIYSNPAAFDSPKAFVAHYSNISTYVAENYMPKTERKLRKLSATLGSKFGKDHSIEIRIIVEFHHSDIRNTVQKVKQSLEKCQA